MPNQEVRLIQNPLLRLHVRPILNWHEFLDRWKVAQDVETFVGLLHRGFKIPLEKRDFSELRYTDFDRIKFYLSVADGWIDDRLLNLPGDDKQKYLAGYNHGNAVYEPTSFFRQQVATKAFEMLCGNFFPAKFKDGMGEVSGEWCNTIFSDELFPLLRSFFETTFNDSNPRVYIRNIPPVWKDRSHYEEAAVGFLLNLTRFIWLWKEYDCSSNNEVINELNKKTRVRIEEAKPWTIEILIGLNRLDALKGLIQSLDQSCMDTLKVHALKRTIYEQGKQRRVSSLDEALYAGSATAQWLLYWRVMNQFSEHLAALAKANEELEEAQQKLTALSSRK